eukprot:4847687-Alexandrium_andersonii.AAC.1
MELEQCKTEPCCWKLVKYADGKPDLKALVPFSQTTTSCWQASSASRIGNSSRTPCGDAGSGPSGSATTCA